ncbi:hypothetical protein DL769_009106 [Monosporascus sp. CRB-8-3]|nr:hypothetical protein DL769_009106 [Monosporascus sp. CRB-8-3]
MRTTVADILPALLLPGLALGHGLIDSPPPRSPGAATARACGQRIVDKIRADPTSYVEGLPELGASDPGYDAAACRLWLCKGLQFEPDDAAAKVQTYRPGQEVAVKVRLAIPHAGRANVSVVDTAADAVIGNGGAPLVSWPSGYADERQFYSGQTPKDQTDFTITIPEDLGGRCAEPGACVSHSAVLKESSSAPLSVSDIV